MQRFLFASPLVLVNSHVNRPLKRYISALSGPEVGREISALTEEGNMKLYVVLTNSYRQLLCKVIVKSTKETKVFHTK